MMGYDDGFHGFIMVYYDGFIMVYYDGFNGLVDDE